MKDIFYKIKQKELKFKINLQFASLTHANTVISYFY